MAQELQDVFRSAAELPEQDRATLAGLLLASLEPDPDPGVEAAWREEIRRRVQEVDSGSVELIPWEEVRKKLFARANED